LYTSPPQGYNRAGVGTEPVTILLSLWIAYLANLSYQ
jgi:hypothetical protein